jgi:hypothetical protein
MTGAGLEQVGEGRRTGIDRLGGDCLVGTGPVGDRLAGDCPAGDCPAGDCPAGDCPAGDRLVGHGRPSMDVSRTRRLGLASSVAFDVHDERHTGGELPEEVLQLQLERRHPARRRGGQSFDHMFDRRARSPS